MALAPGLCTKWGTHAEYQFLDEDLGKRFVSKKEFPKIGSGFSSIRLDSTILPSLSMTTEHLFGVIVKRSEKLDEILPKILNVTSVTYWPISEEGSGERTTVKLAEMIDWAAVLPAFQEA